MENTETTKVYKVKEVAEILRVHWQTILEYIRNGKLKAIKIGKGYRITQEDLDEFLNKSKT